MMRFQVRWRRKDSNRRPITCTGTSGVTLKAVQLSRKRTLSYHAHLSATAKSVRSLPACPPATLTEKLWHNHRAYGSPRQHLSRRQGRIQAFRLKVPVNNQQPFQHTPHHPVRGTLLQEG
jgi:hypothetical protein